MALAFLCTWFVPLAHAEAISDVPAGCDFEVTADSGSTYSFANNLLTLSGGTYTLSMAPGKESTAQTISITGASVITLNGVNISVSAWLPSNSPIGITKDALFDVTINLPDDVTNILEASGGLSYRSAISKDQSSEALGGKLLIQANGNKKNGRISFSNILGVGYNDVANTGYTSNIEIAGGIFTCNNGSFVGADGSLASKAIGININGAVIKQNDYSSPIFTSKGGTSNSSVSGNTVIVGEVTGSDAVTDPLPGMSVDQSVVFWKPSSSSEWTSTMYGSVEIPNDVEFPANLDVPSSSTLAVGKRATLTASDGASLNISGTVQNKGTLDIPADNLVCTGNGKVQTQVVYDTQGGQFVPVSNADDKPSEMRTYKDANSSSVYTYGVLPTSTLAGKDFAGWYVVQDDKQIDITKDSEVMLNEHNFLANYEGDKTVSLTFDASPGTFANTGLYTYAKEGLVPGSTLDLTTIEVPVREGYTFAGWYTKDGVKVDDAYTVRSIPVVLVAHWDELPTPTPEPTPSDSGWEEDEDGWKYILPDGSEAEGWQWIEQDDGGYWYYFGEGNYAITSGWTWVVDHWYYFYENGEMATSTWIWDGAWYWVCSTGPMIQGLWQWIDGAWYGFWWNGAMCQGWVWDSSYSAWFYCFDNGVVARNMWFDGYYFLDSGICLL